MSETEQILMPGTRQSVIFKDLDGYFPFLSFPFAFPKKKKKKTQDEERANSQQERKKLNAHHKTLYLVVFGNGGQTEFVLYEKSKTPKMVGSYALGNLIGEGAHSKVKEAFCSHSLRSFPLFFPFPLPSPLFFFLMAFAFFFFFSSFLFNLKKKNNIMV